MQKTPESKTPHTDGPVADAVVGNWVDRWAPAFARPYLRLSRADRPIGTWLLLIPCWWGGLLAIGHTGHFGRAEAWVLVGCAMGAWLMRGAGCTWNDITDRDFDGKVARTASRPIPSGQVTVKGAVIWMCLQALFAFAILLTFKPLAIMLGIGSLALVAIYPFAKRFTWWPQVFLGLAFNWGAILAWAAITGTFAWAPVFVYIAGIAWTLFYDTIYAHQDKDDDALIGIKSTARLFGDQTPRFLLIFLILSVCFLAAGIISALIDTTNVLALTLALGGPWAFGWHLSWQMRRLDTENPALCGAIFLSNRDAGLILAVFLTITLLL